MSNLWSEVQLTNILIMPTFLGIFRAISNELHSRDFHTQIFHCAVDMRRSKVMPSNIVSTFLILVIMARPKTGLSSSSRLPLVSVTSLNFHEYIMSKLVLHDHHSFFWIRGTDHEQEDNWKWTDGSGFG